MNTLCIYAVGQHKYDNVACPPQALLGLDSLSSGEWRTGDVLGSFRHPLLCFLVRDNAVAIFCKFKGFSVGDGSEKSQTSLSEHFILLR